MDRRAFFSLFAGTAAAGAAAGCAAPLGAGAAAAPVLDLTRRPLLIATWPFGRHGVEKGLETMLAGGSPLDGVEQGIRKVETIGNGSVGLSGRPNAAGYGQLDACIMDGPTHGAGSVAAIEGIVYPITAARRVMENSKHVMLAGDGARWFALDHGVESVDAETWAEIQAQKAAWAAGGAATRQEKASKAGHDTVAILAIDAQGDIAGGCSTSGAGRKLPGRVGDSPILGSGLYVDNTVGAAGATGLGENIMRHNGCYAVVDMMRDGLPPGEAAAEAIHRMAAIDPKGYKLDACFIALDKHGRFGAAASNQRFPFAVGWPGHAEVVKVEQVTPR